MVAEYSSIVHLCRWSCRLCDQTVLTALGGTQLWAFLSFVFQLWCSHPFFSAHCKSQAVPSLNCCLNSSPLCVCVCVCVCVWGWVSRWEPRTGPPCTTTELSVGPGPPLLHSLKRPAWARPTIFRSLSLSLSLSPGLRFLNAAPKHIEYASEVTAAFVHYDPPPPPTPLPPSPRQTTVLLPTRVSLTPNTI